MHVAVVFQEEALLDDRHFEHGEDGMAMMAYAEGVSAKRSAADVARAPARGRVVSFVGVSAIDALAR